LFRRWQRAGVWQRILTGLQTRADALITWDVSVETTIARAHQHAAGARTHPDRQAEPAGGVGEEPADHGLGRSRGGLPTRLHLTCEQGQKPLSMVVTGGQRGDSPRFIPVLARISVPRLSGGRPRTRPDRVLADKAYTSRANAAAASKPRSPARPSRTRPGAAKGKADGHPLSTRSSTANATPWSAASTVSNAAAPSRPDTTSSPSATKPPSASPPST